MAVKALGNLIDVRPCVVPVADLAAGANTGLRLHMKNYGGVLVICYLAAVSAGTDTFVPTLKEANAATGGTLQALATITQWYHQSEATLDNDEQWVRVTQAAASTVSLTGATFAASQMIVAFEVDADDLSDGFEWISVDLPDAGSGGTRPGGILYIPYGLKQSRRPDRLPQANA